MKFIKFKSIIIKNENTLPFMMIMASFVQLMFIIQSIFAKVFKLLLVQIHTSTHKLFQTFQTL